MTWWLKPFVLALAVCLPLSSDAGADARERAPAANDHRSPVAARPCTCRYGGGDYKIGETACIRGVQATCGLVLNNTSWTFSDRPCLNLSSRGALHDKT